MKTAARAFGLVATAAAVVAGLVFLAMMTSAESAPQEAAGAGIALAIAVIPYVFARGLEMYADKPRAEE